MLEAAELYWLFLDDAVDLITHTAHRFDTSLEHFTRIRSLVETTPDLMRQVKSISDTNGKERIQLRNGKRLQFKARAKGGGRGFSGDRVVLDEAFYITDLGSLIPTMSAREDPQLWWVSSAPLRGVESAALRKVIRRGRAGDMAYAEWSCEPGVDLDDREQCASANPSYGGLLGEDFIWNVERKTLSDEEFARERFGVFVVEQEKTAEWLVISEEDWIECRSTERGKRADRPGWLIDAVDLAIEVRPDRSSASIGVAGACREGGVGVDVVAHGAGTGWIVGRVLELTSNPERPVGKVVIDGGGPAASLIPELEAAGVVVTEAKYADVKLATADFFDAVMERDAVHRDRPELNDAVAWATKRTAGDGWLIDRKTDHDATPLVAVTLAHWAHLTAVPPVPEPDFIVL